MEIFVVGLHKDKDNITGMRLLAVKDDLSTEIADKDANLIKCGIAQGKVNIKNLKIENGELKGVNGSLDRYGIVNSNKMAIVILNEIHDGNGNKVGFMCADSNGRVKKLKEEDVIKIGELTSIANGKIVTVNDKKHISAIEGNYTVKNMTQYAPKVEDTSKNDTSNNTETNALPKEILDIIDELEKHPDFEKDFAHSIVITIKKTQRCSEKQKAILVSRLNMYRGVSNINKLDAETQNLIAELKKNINKLDAIEKRIIESVESAGTISSKQKWRLEKALERINDAAKTTPAPAQKSAQATSSLSSQPAPQPKTPAQATSAPAPTPVSKPDNTAATRKINEKNNRISQEISDEIKKELLAAEARKKDAKAKRLMNQNIRTVGNYDYSLHKGKTAYVEGFSSTAKDIANVVIPDTIDVDGVTYTIKGITIGAFENEPKIETVTISSHISDIGQHAFAHNHRLRKVDLSAGTHASIASYAFYNCLNLEEIKVGNYIERVHEYAFENCLKLKRVDLPECCTTIARFAFKGCNQLETVTGAVKNTDYGAFYYCNNLKEFNFASMLSFGPRSFARCAFEEVVITGKTDNIGDYAFEDNILLKKVTIEEGVKKIGDYAFAKPDVSTDTAEMSKIHELYAPKSIEEIGKDPFRHVELVIGYTGTLAESRCIAYKTPFKSLDGVNADNSTRVRINAPIIGADPLELVYESLLDEEEGGLNPDIDLNEKKLKNMEMPMDLLNQLGLEVPSSDEKKPHALFVAAVNYLQDVADLDAVPLSTQVARLYGMLNINPEIIYTDGYNYIYKMTCTIMDSLEEGSYILVMQGRNVRYVVDCNLLTDIKISDKYGTDGMLEVHKYIHMGDIIGYDTTIDGKSGAYVDEEGHRHYPGRDLYTRIMNNSIQIATAKKDLYVYIPSDDTGLMLKSRLGDTENGKKIENDSYSVLESYDYDGFIKAIKKTKKNLGGSSQFFAGMAKYTDKKVNSLISKINVVEEEKEAHLFKLSKEFGKIVLANNTTPNPNMLTPELFDGLSKSYWMVPKDLDWYTSIGKRSLNKTSEYHVGNKKVTEYKSNQVVKFSNPYMNGKKGAYIFVLESNNQVQGVYASRYTLLRITEKLFELTSIKNETVIPTEGLMDNPSEFQYYDADLFYHFYDVLSVKDGWDTKEITGIKSSFQYTHGFSISMYKPTGIFYLTIEKLMPVSYVERVYRTAKVMPILPIGNMERALLVADTTNTSARKTKMLEEMLSLAMIVAYKRNDIKRYDWGYRGNDKISKAEDYLLRFIKARELALNGVKDAREYKKYICDRVVYMLGTVHKGQLLVEDEVNYDDDIDIQPSELIIEDEDDTDAWELEDDDEDIESEEDIADEEDDELFADGEISFDDDEDEDDEEYTYDNFAKVARENGMTDETQIQAAYANFMSSRG